MSEWRRHLDRPIALLEPTPARTQWYFSFGWDIECAQVRCRTERTAHLCNCYNSRQAGSKPMEANTPVLQRVFVKFPMKSSDTGSPIDVRVSDADVVSSLGLY